jgi:dUTPase
VKRATEEIARKQREEEEAKQLRLKAQREAEARRLKQKAVRNAIIADIAKSIEAVVEIESSIAVAVASAMLDGKIDRVSVDTNQPIGVPVSA